MSGPKSTQVHRHYLEILHRVSKEATFGTTPEDRLSHLVSLIATELSWDVCSIYLLDPKTNALTLVATQGLNPESVGKISIPIGEGVVGYAAKEEESLFLEKAYNDTRFKYFPETKEEQYSSLAAVPFFKNGMISGIFTVQTKEPFKFYTADQNFLELIAQQIGQAVSAALSIKNIHKQNMTILTGTPISEGLVLAPVKILSAQKAAHEMVHRKFTNIKDECLLFKSALHKALDEISNIIISLEKTSHMAAQIFLVQKMILNDEEFIHKVYSAIRSQKMSAPQATSAVLGEYIQKFSTMDNSLLKEKEQDLRDLQTTLLKHMDERSSERTQEDVSQQKHVIVAKDLTPRQTIQLNPETTAALITESGSEFSHISILAKALQLPAIVGIQGLMSSIKPNDQLLVDGANGFVHINPDKQTQKILADKQDLAKKKIETIKTFTQTNPSVKHKKKYSIQANIGLPFEIDQAFKENIHSVGLLRTEFYYIQQQSWPSEESQINFYAHILRSFPDNEVTIRLLDIGGDKFLSYFPELNEENPHLGFRSIRFLLDHTEYLQSQLLCIHKAALQTKRKPKILIPMISHAWEVDAVRDHLSNVSEGEEYSLGMMLEVPSLIFKLSELTPKVDFISIGTNDLLQYLLAIDRNNARVSHLYNPLDKAVINTLSFLVHQLQQSHKPFSICGELSTDPLAGLALLALGYTHFSLPPGQAWKLRYLLHQINDKQLNQIKEQLLKSPSTYHSERFLRSIIRKWAPLLAEV